MRPGGGRSKGHNFERLVAARCRAHWPDARRGLQGRDGGDAPDVDGVPHWWIETKIGAPAKSPEKALRQAEYDSRRELVRRERAGQPPQILQAVAVCKIDRHEPMAYLRLGTLHPASPKPQTMVCISFDDWLALASTF